MIKINYKSDFKINEKSETVALEVPFVFSYYVFDSKKYVVSFDGHNYVNCERKEDGSLDVIFNQPDFGIGHLKVERKYAVDDTAFADGVFDVVTVDKTDVFITSGKTFETYVETLVVPPYLKGDKGDPMTWSTMTETEREELVHDVAEAIDPEMVMTENEKSRQEAEQGRQTAEQQRSTTFNTLKGEMQSAITAGNAAAGNAQKVVDEYDEKVAEQDGKLTELGSEVASLNSLGFKEGKAYTVNSTTGYLTERSIDGYDTIKTYVNTGDVVTIKAKGNGAFRTYIICDINGKATRYSDGGSVDSKFTIAENERIIVVQQYLSSNNPYSLIINGSNGRGDIIKQLEDNNARMTRLDMRTLVTDSVAENNYVFKDFEISDDIETSVQINIAGIQYGSSYSSYSYELIEIEPNTIFQVSYATNGYTSNITLCSLLNSREDFVQGAMPIKIIGGGEKLSPQTFKFADAKYIAVLNVGGKRQCNVKKLDIIKFNDLYSRFKARKSKGYYVRSSTNGKLSYRDSTSLEHYYIHANAGDVFSITAKGEGFGQTYFTADRFGKVLREGGTSKLDGYNITLNDEESILVVNNSVSNKDSEVTLVSSLLHGVSENTKKITELCNVGLKGKRILCLGDSITEMTDRIRGGYASTFQELTGAEVINVGIGGSHIEKIRPLVTDVSDYIDQLSGYDWLSIVAITEQLKSGEWQGARNAAAYLSNNYGDDNTQTVERLASVDILNIDVVTIFAGTNGYTIEDKGDVDGIDDMKPLSALNLAIRNLLEANPSLSIFVFSPIPRYGVNEADKKGDVDESYNPDSEGWTWNDDYFSDNYKDGVMLKLIDGIKSVCNNNHIPFCDLYHEIGINKYSFKAWFVSGDGVHPINGLHRIARKMYGFIMGKLYTDFPYK